MEKRKQSFGSEKKKQGTIFAVTKERKKQS